MTRARSRATARTHVVLGPDRHGVTEHSAELAATLGAPVLRVRDHRDLPAALAGLPAGTPLHLGFTDRIWGADPAAAADAVRRTCAGLDATVTLHDVPQPSDGEISFRARADCYRAVASAASAVVVASHHERLLLEEVGIDREPTVIPLPLPDLPEAAEPALPGLDAAVAVFGFLYPGKGHAEIVDALALAGIGGASVPAAEHAGGPGLVALGECSEGHEDLADDLITRGERCEVRVEVSGYVPAGRLGADLEAAAVPAAPHRHVSASGSIAAWISAGRRPLTAENRYTRELAERWPGTVTLVADGDWPEAIRRAWTDPATTRLRTVPRWGWSEVCTAYRRFWIARERIAAPVPGNRWDLLDGVTSPRPPRVDVVVIHYRDPGRLALVLDALAAQTHPAGRLRVIVADDGSPDPPAVPEGVTLVRQEDRGFRAAAARNLGAAAGDGDVLVFLDGDTVPEPGFVAAISRLPSVAPEAVVVGRRRYARLTGPGADPETTLPDPQWLVDGYRDTRNLLDADDRAYRYVLSSVLACSRTFFEELGGFAGDMVGYGGEDWEFGWRAWQAGALLAHEPEAVAWHDGPDFGVRSTDDPAAALATKNAETLALAGRITEPGARPGGVVSARPDLAVTVTGADDEAAVLLTASAVLAGADCALAVPGPVPALLAADPRVHAYAVPAGIVDVRAEVTLAAGVAPTRGALAEAVNRTNRCGLADVGLVVDGRRAGRLATRRGRARVERWGAPDPGRDATLGLSGRWIAEPRLEAHFGGWGG